MRKPSTNLTRQRIIEFIRTFFDERGYAPTVRDIMRGCSLSSTAVVQHHLKVLENEHLIERDSHVFRSIQLPEKKNPNRVPILGTISAGSPIPVTMPETWHNDAVDTIEIPPELFKQQDVFALKVRGQSMIDAFIDDGDIVIFRQAKSADNGDMVAVWLKNEQEVTLKRFFKEGEKVRLQPANQQMNPIIVAADNIEVQGKVVGVIRAL